eukprot:1138503-Pelagomonas_calceolata.AAC.16
MSSQAAIAIKTCATVRLPAFCYCAVLPIHWAAQHLLTLRGVLCGVHRALLSCRIHTIRSISVSLATGMIHACLANEAGLQIYAYKVPGCLKFARVLSLIACKHE